MELLHALVLCHRCVAGPAVVQSESLLRGRRWQDLLNCVPHLTLGRLTPHELLEGIVLVNELVDGHETSANSDDEVALDALHDDLLLEEAVCTFGLSDEEALHPLGVHALVDEL